MRYLIFTPKFRYFIWGSIGLVLHHLFLNEQRSKRSYKVKTPILLEIPEFWNAGVTSTDF